jgi:hypothetical protein
MSPLDMFPETRVAPDLDGDRRYTTPETMDLCMRLAGVNGWDLDVAADKESHCAPRWFDVTQDGLAQRWDARRIWCNPPFSDIEPWLSKAWRQICECDVIAMLLPANRTEQPWWQELVESCRDGRWVSREHRLALVRSCGELSTHFLPTRVKYGHPGNPKGVGVGSPPFASVLLVWRSP